MTEWQSMETAPKDGTASMSDNHYDLIAVLTTRLGNELLAEVTETINKRLKVGVLINKEKSEYLILALEPNLRTTHPST